MWGRGKGVGLGFGQGRDWGNTVSGLFEMAVALRLGLYSSSSKRDVTNSRGEVSCVTFTIRVFRPKACVVIYCQ